MDSGDFSSKVVAAAAAAAAEKTMSDASDNNHQYIMKQISHNPARFVLISIMFFVACIVIYHSAAYPLQVFSGAFFTLSPPKHNLSTPFGEDHSLENVLSKASMDDNTVILTSLNQAWIAPNSVFDLFLHSFRIGNETLKLLDHLVIIAVDEHAYNRCIAIHPHCYYLTSNDMDFSAAARFMTPIYFKMMWRRTEFLSKVLDLGYNFIFTDTDIMWFRNPFPRFHPNTDFQIASDFYKGNPSDMHNLPNGGFIYAKSNNRTTKFYKYWLNSRKRYPGLNEQDILNKIKFDPYINEIGVRIKFLDTAYFGGFCQPSRDLNKVCTMHANCCVGLSNKVYDLNIVLGVWQNYMSAGKINHRRLTQSSPWNAPDHCKPP